MSINPHVASLHGDGPAFLASLAGFGVAAPIGSPFLRSPWRAQEISAGLERRATIESRDLSIDVGRNHVTTPLLANPDIGSGFVNPNLVGVQDSLTGDSGGTVRRIALDRVSHVG